MIESIKASEFWLNCGFICVRLSSGTQGFYTRRMKCNVRIRQQVFRTNEQHRVRHGIFCFYTVPQPITLLLSGRFKAQARRRESKSTEALCRRTAESRVANFPNPGLYSAQVANMVKMASLKLIQSQKFLRRSNQ